MFQWVKLTEHNISACSFHGISLEDLDFNGCMFTEMMTQRWSCFLHRLYPRATQHVWVDCSASPAHGRHAVIRCMHKWCHHALGSAKWNCIYTQAIIVQHNCFCSVWIWIPDIIIVLFQHCMYAENDLAYHVMPWYHPHDYCSWHTRPCTHLLVVYLFHELCKHSNKYPQLQNHATWSCSTTITTPHYHPSRYQTLFG